MDLYLKTFTDVKHLTVELDSTVGDVRKHLGGIGDVLIDYDDSDPLSSTDITQDTIINVTYTYISVIINSPKSSDSVQTLTDILYTKNMKMWQLIEEVEDIIGWKVLDMTKDLSFSTQNTNIITISRSYSLFEDIDPLCTYICTKDRPLEVGIIELGYSTMNDNDTQRVSTGVSVNLSPNNTSKRLHIKTREGFIGDCVRVLKVAPPGSFPVYFNPMTDELFALDDGKCDVDFTHMRCN